jgi:hypothetical protein
MNFDAGTTAAPAVGATVTGGSSSSVGVVISVTVTSGAWVSNSAAGSIELGGCSGRFNDNETAAYTGGQVTVNEPDSAAGVDLVQNGEFLNNTDPPPGWTASGATLTTEASGQVGNCLMITDSGSGNGYAYQTLTLTVGKLYKFSGYFKKGTSVSGSIKLGTTLAGSEYKSWTGLTDAAWANYQYVFMASSTSFYVTYTSVTASSTIYGDGISVYEITPYCQLNTANAPDGWNKSYGSIFLFREGLNNKAGSNFCLKCIPTAQWAYVIYPNEGRNDNAQFIKTFVGRTVTLGGWVKSSTANDVDLWIYNGATGGAVHSNRHTGSGNWEWLEVSKEIVLDTSLHFGLSFGNTTPGIAFLSQPMLILGTTIGAGNYATKPDEVIYFETKIDSQLFDNKTGSNGFSDVSPVAINFFSDSFGAIPQNIKALKVSIEANDSVSSTTDCFFIASQDISEVDNEFICSPYGLPDDTKQRYIGWISVNENDLFEYQVEASGAGTFDIRKFHYIGVMLR